MGSSESKIKLENYSKTIEGSTIEKIGNSNFEQNIYVLGNYDMKFFTDNISEIPKNPYSAVNTYYKMSRHQQIKEWHFFFAQKTENFEETKKSAKNFYYDHYSRDPDDFSEKKFTRKGKVLFLYFNDKYNYDFAESLLEEFEENMPFIIFIGKDDENNKLKEKIIKKVKDLKVQIDTNFFKFTNLTDKIEDDLIQLTINLIECASFFNELGDEFKFPKKLIDDKVMENDLKNFTNHIFSFNIAILGRPGAGKSSFINKMINSVICKAGIGGECSSRIIKYLHRKYPITFFDTPGISEEKISDEVLDLIRLKNIELKENRSRIHAIFYMIDGSQSRFFMNYEKKILKAIFEEIKIPVYFIMTKLQNEEKGNKKVYFVIQNFRKITDGINIQNQYRGDNNIKNYIFYVNVIGEHLMGLNKLFLKLYKDFRGYIIEEKINKDNIQNLTRHSLIGFLSQPEEIATHPKIACEYLTFIYRLMARAISSKAKGSTNLSAAFLKEINYIYGNINITLNDCKRMIECDNFSIDNKSNNQNKKYKTFWFMKNYWDYRTPAEEQIDYLNYHYVKIFEKKLYQNKEQCLIYINKLRESINFAINGFIEISQASQE